MTPWRNANAKPAEDPLMPETVAAPVTVSAPAPPSSPSPPGPVAAPPSPSGERISDAHYDNLPADQQAKYSRVRASSDGGSAWQARRDLGVDGKPAPAPATTPASDSQQAQFIDGKLVLGDAELTAADVRELLALKADRALRQTQIPAGPEGYAPTLPQNLKLPEGVTVAIDNKDPAFADLTRVAHRAGLSQSDFSDLIGVYAAKQAAEANQLQTAIRAEIAKLGPNGSQRIGAITTWLRSAVGSDDLAKALSQMMVTAKHVEALEKLADKFMSGGAASFSQSHREPGPGNGKVSDEEYAKMSAAQKWAYARSFSNK
jgi:hypothetical protein